MFVWFRSPDGLLEYFVTPPGSILDAVQVSSDYIPRLKIHKVGSMMKNIALLYGVGCLLKNFVDFMCIHRVWVFM